MWIWWCLVAAVFVSALPFLGAGVSEHPQWSTKQGVRVGWRSILPLLTPPVIRHRRRFHGALMHIDKVIDFRIWLLEFVTFISVISLSWVEISPSAAVFCTEWGRVTVFFGIALSRAVLTLQPCYVRYPQRATRRVAHYIFCVDGLYFVWLFNWLTLSSTGSECGNWYSNWNSEVLHSTVSCHEETVCEAWVRMKNPGIGIAVRRRV